VPNVVWWLCFSSLAKKNPAGDLFTDYGINVCGMVKTRRVKKIIKKGFFVANDTLLQLALSSTLLMDSTKHE